MGNMNDVPQNARGVADLSTVGWRIVIGGLPNAYIFADRPVSFDDSRLQRLVLLDEAAAAISLRNAEIEAWRKTAEQAHRNTEFYRDLVERCGQAIGKEAYICDDGSVSTSVLALKVPELIEAAFKPRNRFLRALSAILTGK